MADTVRTLVRQAREDSADGGPEAASGVLLNVTVDGVRCVPVRLPVQKPGWDLVVLSPREQEIARMVAKGYPNKTITAVLDISSWTGGTYIRRIFAKHRVGTRSAMVDKLQIRTAFPGFPTTEGD